MESGMKSHAMDDKRRRKRAREEEREGEDDEEEDDEEIRGGEGGEKEVKAKSERGRGKSNRKMNRGKI